MKYTSIEVKITSTHPKWLTRPMNHSKIFALPLGNIYQVEEK